jgi:hypothetical protein
MSFLTPGCPSLEGPLELGVLLVHGIGRQRRGETLVSWLDAIVHTIDAATRHRVSACVEYANLGSPAGDRPTPAHAILRLRSEGVDARWLFAEAWWAETFATPSFGQLVSWSFRAIPWAIATHATQRHYLRMKRARRGLPRRLTGARAVGELSIALFLAPFVASGLALLLLVGLIPIGAVRSAVGAIQRALAATVGDSMVLMESPSRSAAIRSEVMSASAWLRAACDSRGCGRSAILAHSQGAAITLEALGGIGASATGSTTEQQPAPSGSRASVLVTFGSGVNKLAALRSLGGGNSGRTERAGGKTVSFLERDPIRVVSLCLLGAAGVGVWFWRLLATGQLTSRQLWLVPAAWFGGSLLLGTIAAGARRFVRGPGRRRPWLRKIVIGVLVMLFLALVVASVIASEATKTPVWPFLALFFLLLTLIGAFRETLSPWFQKRLRREVHAPPGVEEWVDFWASADPVPSGPTRTRKRRLPVSTEIWNEASLLRDHTRYWANRDGFTLPVVRILARAARSAWEGLLPDEGDTTLARARWRTGWLRAARWLVPASLIPFAVFTSRGLEEIWRRQVSGFDVFLGEAAAGWLRRSPAPWAAAFRWGVVVTAAWAAYEIALAAWRWWIRTEQDQVLNHERPTGVTTGLWAFGVALALLTIGISQLPTFVLTVPPAELTLATLGEGIMVVAVWSCILVWLVTKAFPPPSGTEAK